MLTTVIGAYPKPSYLKLPDWFNVEGGTDTQYPTKDYQNAIKKMGGKVVRTVAMELSRGCPYTVLFVVYQCSNISIKLHEIYSQNSKDLK